MTSQPRMLPEMARTVVTSSVWGGQGTLIPIRQWAVAELLAPSITLAGNSVKPVELGQGGPVECWTPSTMCRC